VSSATVWKVKANDDGSQRFARLAPNLLYDVERIDTCNLFRHRMDRTSRNDPGERDNG
jgi:hypothetical protein